MKVTRFSHASLNVVGQLDETSRFYEDVLGMRDVPRPEALQPITGAWVQGGDAQVHLVAVEPGERPRNPLGPHFAVYVEDLAEAIEELEAGNIPYRRFGEGDETQIWISDPAGNTIELNQDRATGSRGSDTGSGG